MVVTNAGPSNATGASVADTIPAAITGVSINCAPTGTASCGTNASVGNALSFTGVNIAAGAGNFLTITVSGTVNPATTGNLVNTVTVTAGAGQTDPTPANNTATDTDTPSPQTDLAITKTDGSATYTAGTGLTYTMVVTNAGPSNATGASVADTIPAAITGVSINCAATGTATCGTNASVGNNLSFTGVDIAAGAGNFLTITVSGTVNPATTGNLVNTVTVTAGAGQTDPTPANNTATDTDTPAPVANMVISKTNGVLSLNAGTSTTYTVVVTNPGPSVADGAVVTDPLVAGLSKTAASCLGTTGGAVCPGTVTTALLEGAGVEIPTFPVGGTVTFTVTATVTAGSGTVKNSASVTPPAGTTNLGTNCSTLPDPNSRNFSANVCTAGDQDNVSAVVDLFISKTDGTPTYIPGATLTYTVVVANNGPSPALGVVVTDTKPSQITTWTWTCDPPATGGATGCTPAAASANNFSDTIDLPANSTISYTVVATVSGSALTTIVNKATATPSAGTNTGTSCVTSGGITRSFNDPTTGACSSTDTDTLGLGIGGGHFDFDVYYFDTGKYKNKKHIHQWDNKWNVTGVNVVLPSDVNFRTTSFMLAGTPFKVLVANQYLNPAAFLAVGTGATQESVKTFGGLAGPSTDAATVLGGLTTYTAPGTSYNPDGSTVRLIINLPVTAFNSIDWWGAGGDGQPRAGVIPNQTGCVNGVNDNGSTDDVGKLGERFNGALTVTIIKADTPADAIELNVPGDPRYGWRVKVTAAPNPFPLWVLGEYTMFWHHPNGECYNEVTWVPNPPLEDETGTPDPRPTGTADPTGPIPPNPTIQ